jgi:NAD(P)-dependent dehydrogenase (short-subunit alcohol dehydrogenase family)
MNIIHQPGKSVTRDQRTSFVTGGTGGIGRAVAIELARGGDRVFFTGRDERRGAEVLATLRALNPAAEHVFVPGDASLLSGTARVADEIVARTHRLDAIVFCAGILSTIPEWTPEGMERNLVLNYISRYLMARRLLPFLKQSPSGRLVLVANAGKYADTLDFDDLQHRRGKPGLAVSGRTQFANDLLALELAERLRNTRIEATCVFPGLVRTDVFRNARGLPRLMKVIAVAVQPLVAALPSRAAATPVFLAQDAGAVGTGGRFWGPGNKEITIPARVRDSARRLALWEASERLVSRYLEAESPATA